MFECLDGGTREQSEPRRGIFGEDAGSLPPPKSGRRVRSVPTDRRVSLSPVSFLSLSPKSAAGGHGPGCLHRETRSSGAGEAPPRRHAVSPPRTPPPASASHDSPTANPSELRGQAARPLRPCLCTTRRDVEEERGTNELEALLWVLMQKHQRERFADIGFVDF